MRKFFKALRKSEKGATAIEYGLIAALVAVAAITAMTSVGSSLKKTFDNINTEIKKGNAATPSAQCFTVNITDRLIEALGSISQGLYFFQRTGHDIQNSQKNIFL